MDDLVLQINKDGTLLEFRGKTDNGLLVSTDGIVGRSIYDVLVPDIAQPVMNCVEKALQTGDMQSLEYQHWMNDYHYALRFIVTGDNKVLVIIGDISDYKHAAKKVEYLEYHDILTDLPNRYMFNDRLKQAIAHADREKKLLAVLFLDIDNFNQINDTIGHNAGDFLLKSFAERLTKEVRTADSVAHLSEAKTGSMMARFGGDEFTVLLNEIEDVHDPAKVARRILKMLSVPFIIDAQEVFVTASMGIAVFPVDGKDTDTLLINADVAMSQAKKHGRNSYQYYSSSLNKFALERFTIENKLRKALEHNEFMLFYQPQLDLRNGVLLGVEALIRWLQPDLILTRPGEFIPLAERTGLIIPMGEWILRAACEQNRAWQKAGLRPMLMTVNVSGIQFSQRNFVETVYRILGDTGLGPNYLQLELTESTIMQDTDQTIKKLLALKEMGVQISIDDFGTGYSSLKYLKRFPLSTLKIDNSFVKDLTSSPTDQSIVNAIITLGHNFDLKVIAEGVETKEQLAYLRGCGCEGVQGFLICPPVNSIALAEFTKRKVLLSS
ncbi:MAG TPA: EAL domain-containing protein [Thermodesulfovibrionales bacterium]|nr:EAL domain-containing protein [Thermodesulfovibrionales bacterium]